MATLQELLDEGLAHHRAGRLEAAGKCYETALTLAPSDGEANHLSGMLAYQSGRLEDAAACFRRATDSDPATAKYHGNLGAVLLAMGRHDGALESLDRAVALDPLAANVPTNRALALLRLGRHEESMRVARQATSTAPRDASAQAALGMALTALERLEDAVPVLHRAVDLAPKDAPTRDSLAYALHRLYRHDEAMVELRASLALAPDRADGWNNLGQAHRAAGDMAPAITAFDRALALDDRHRDARFGRSRAALMLGRWSAGWADYQARDIGADADARYHREPLPPDLAGRHVFVDRDQGIGDEIFFLRFLPALASRGCRITYRSDRRLAPMLRRAGIARHVIAQGETADPADHTVAVGDLPFLLGHGDGDPLPPSITLAAVAEHSAVWQARLASAGPPPYIGLTWRAGVSAGNRAARKQVSPAGLGRAIRDAPGTFVAVQRNPEDGELEALIESTGRPVADFTAVNDDLEDALALMGLLDRYICVSNANLHFRAALGRTGNVLIPCPPEFRWMAAGDESPWFPGMAVSRQRPDGDWSDALAALKYSLQTAVDTRP